MNCKCCDNLLPDDARFCHICGAPIEKVTDKKEDNIAYYKSDGTLGYMAKSDVPIKDSAKGSSDSVCKNCGCQLPVNVKFCPNCAEPTNSQNEYHYNTPEEDLSNALAKRFVKGTLISSVLSFLFSFIVTFAINDSLSGFWGYFFSALFFCLIFVVIDLMRVRNDDRKANILTQFERDATSICPMCGSHSVKIYRKGYNWNEAFWGSMFNIKGSRYTAGMNSNDAMCHCQHCGHSWNSGYDYRKIR